MIERRLKFHLDKLIEDLHVEYNYFVEFRKLCGEVERLQTENSDFENKLKRSVEFPAKLGDVVFFFDFDKDKIQQGKVVGLRLDYFTPSNPIWVKIQYDIPMVKSDCDIEVWASMVFVTREAAEARLAELKGERK